MKEVTFDPAGGPLEAEVSCQPRRDGSYALKLWAADDNTKLKQWDGNFMNPADDRYTLPGAAADQDGRILEAMVVVAVPGGVGPATIVLTVSQDGVGLGQESGSVPPNSPAGFVDLFIRLRAAS